MIHSKLIFIMFNVDTTFQVTNFEHQGEQVFSCVSEARERERQKEIDLVHRIGLCDCGG